MPSEIRVAEEEAEDFLTQVWSVYKLREEHENPPPPPTRDIVLEDLSDPVPEVPPDKWRGWLEALFPRHVRATFAHFHERFHEWAWAIELDKYAPPFILAWARGAAKSTSVELAIAYMAARGTRRYCLYIHAVQDKANEHVMSIGALLESPRFSQLYPDASRRRVGKYGSSSGWRRDRLRTASGFTVDALGLDVALRGVKVEAERPDVIVLDDVDELFDDEARVKKKIKLLTQSLLPAGSNDCVVIFAQNLIHSDSIASQLVDGRADFLQDRIVSGPYPAVDNLVYHTDPTDGRVYIDSGEPLWSGQDIEACQIFIWREGLSSFLIECQHDVDVFNEGMFKNVEFRHCKLAEVPPLLRVVVWVDPAVTNKDTSDSQGIQVDGLARDGTIYRLYTWEARSSPEDAMKRALRLAVLFKAEAVGVETDQGGDTWISVFRESWRSLVMDPREETITQKTPIPKYRYAKAGEGHGPKAQRGQQLVAQYELAKFIHVEGTHLALERALRRYLIKKPFDVVDAGYWSWYDLAKRPATAGATWESLTEPSKWSIG